MKKPRGKVINHKNKILINTIDLSLKTMFETQIVAATLLFNGYTVSVKIYSDKNYAIKAGK